MRLKESGEFKLPRSVADVNRSIYIHEDNKFSLNCRNSFCNCMIELNLEAGCILSKNTKSAKIPLIKGKSLNKQFYQFGPFVMNVRAKIKEAFGDYDNTSFGGRVWKNVSSTNQQYIGKFAKLINGKSLKQDNLYCTIIKSHTYRVFNYENLFRFLNWNTKG